MMNKSEYENLNDEPIVVNGFIKYFLMSFAFTIFCVAMPIGVGAIGVMSAIMSAALFIKEEVTFVEAFSAGTVILILCATFISIMWRNPMGKVKFLYNDEEIKKK